MSSSASILGQKLKETIGISKVHDDPDLLETKTRLEALNKQVEILQSVLSSYVKSQLTLVGASRNQALEQIMKAQSVLPFSQANTLYAQFSNTITNLNSEVSNRLQDAFHKAVISPLVEWHVQIQKQLEELKEVDQRRVIYSHYQEKVNSIEQEKNNVLLKGKLFTENEKLTRNRSKLAESKAQYEEILVQGMAKSLAILSEARYHLDVVLLRMIQFEQQCNTEMGKALGSLSSVGSALIVQNRDRKTTASMVNLLQVLVVSIRQSREKEPITPGAKRLNIDELLERVTPRPANSTDVVVPNVAQTSPSTAPPSNPFGSGSSLDPSLSTESSLQSAFVVARKSSTSTSGTVSNPMNNPVSANSVEPNVAPSQNSNVSAATVMASGSSAAGTSNASSSSGGLFKKVFSKGNPFGSQESSTSEASGAAHSRASNSNEQITTSTTSGTSKSILGGFSFGRAKDASHSRSRGNSLQLNDSFEDECTAPSAPPLNASEPSVSAGAASTAANSVVPSATPATVSMSSTFDAFASPTFDPFGTAAPTGAAVGHFGSSSDAFDPFGSASKSPVPSVSVAPVRLGTLPSAASTLPQSGAGAAARRGRPHVPAAAVTPVTSINAPLKESAPFDPFASTDFGVSASPATEGMSTSTNGAIFNPFGQLAPGGALMAPPPQQSRNSDDIFAGL